MWRILSSLTFTLYLLCIGLVSCSETTVDYSQPLSWGGICQNGTAQSPIDINTKKL